jgi:UDP:flavonoid glycosyltransferase YjiC (YdhE family)
VRILFTFAGGSGHLNPLIPLARAAVSGGHEAAFAGRPWMSPMVQAAGFTAFSAGCDTGLTPKRRPLLKLDPEREDQALREGFARRIARERAADLLVLMAAWQPDLVVCEETDFGAMLAAERRGLPYASLLVMAAGSFVRQAVVAEPLQELRAEFGLRPDPDLAMLSRYLVLSPFPPSFRDPGFPLPATTHGFRPTTLDPAQYNPAPPPWLAPADGLPVVYFTLGTVFNMECGDLFQRVLAGLRGLPIHLMVTVGRDIDPAEFGPQPANVQIERYIPQSWILPQCDLVVSHAGSGSFIGALAHGLPLVLIPMGADQPLNAARCADLGLAQVLDAVEATPESVRKAASVLLADRSYRRAAEGMRAELAALPDLALAVRLLERLAVEKRPLLA